MYRSKDPILPGWLSLILSVAFVLAGVTVVVFAYLTFEVVWARAANPLEAAAAEVADVGLQMVQNGPAPVPTLLPGQPTPTLIPTSEARVEDDRVTVLVMGIDRRPGEPFISRTDSMMLISVDSTEEKASVLSIPRDLYVVIPGHGRDRINTAFVYGSTGNNPAAGAALALQTVEYNLGVHVDHYALLDFGAVIDSIDTLGGIDVYVPFDINDPTFPDMNYGYDPLYIPAGLQHMNGELALKYARTRHMDNDFGRAARQQQVLLAARDKALGLGLTGLITRAPELYGSVEDSIRTDMGLDQLVSLARTVSGIPEDVIRNEVLDQNYVSSHLTEQGAQVLVLQPDQASSLIEELFYRDE